ARLRRAGARRLPVSARTSLPPAVGAAPSPAGGRAADPAHAVQLVASQLVGAQQLGSNRRVRRATQSRSPPAAPAQADATPLPCALLAPAALAASPPPRPLPRLPARLD